MKYFLYFYNNLLQSTHFTCSSKPGQKNPYILLSRMINQVKPKGDYANEHSGCQVFSSNNCFELLYIQRKEQTPYGRINYLLVYALSDTLLSLSKTSGSGNYEKKTAVIINRSDNPIRIV